MKPAVVLNASSNELPTPANQALTVIRYNITRSDPLNNFYNIGIIRM